jgi:uncharacterized protein YndB with AHSA1/START domain
MHIAAERVVAAPPEAVFGFLADLENHWLLADRFVDVLSLERAAGDGPAHGGAVRVRGPLGLGRTVHTRVVAASAPRSVAGTAAAGRGTNALIRWTLTPAEPGTRVCLDARIECARRADALLLAAGGRKWLERRFAGILDTLARQLAA